MTEPSLSLIHAERNPRNSVVQEPEQDTKSLTVKYVFTVTTCLCSTRTAPQAGERHLPCYIFLFTLFIANKLREREKPVVLLLEEFRMMNRTIIPIRRLTNVRGALFVCDMQERMSDMVVKYLASKLTVSKCGIR